MVRAVDEVTLSLDAGETLGIVGESGSGKSTLALTILRLLPPAARIVSGRMMFEGEDLLDKSDAEMRQRARQAHRHDPAGPDGLAEPAVHHRRPGRRADPRARGREPRQRLAARASALLKSVRIASPRDPRDAVSRTRCPAACASASSAPSASPASRGCSSPTSRPPASTSRSRRSTSNLLRDLQREHGLALIFITHNLGIVAKMCDQLAVMYAGRVVEHGPVSQHLQRARRIPTPRRCSARSRA